MSGPYRDSSESLLLPQAGTAAGGRKRYACKTALLYFLFILLTNQELCGILATIVEQSRNGRKGKQSENESKHEKKL